MRLARFFRDIGRPVASVEPGAPKPVDFEIKSSTRFRSATGTRVWGRLIGGERH
jgi:hypothetical protein